MGLMDWCVCVYVCIYVCVCVHTHAGVYIILDEINT